MMMVVVVVVVVMIIIMVMVIVMMIIMVVVMVVMIIILSQHDRFSVSGSFVGAALILGAQNALGVRDRVQQFGERAGRFKHRAGLAEGGSGGRRLNAAKERERRGAAEQADEGLVQAMSFPV
jgi:biopolymer transport protein ExbB/TolQ